MLEQLVNWLLQTLRDVGYPGIVALMAMESSILPVPAELVMPPAGYWVAKGEMNAWIVLACGTVGSVLGALANYWMAHVLGRAFVRRFGRYVLLSERSLDRAERFFADHGEISTLVGRLLPVLRHLISIPAGIARMSVSRFVTFTALGAFAWCAVLTGIGYFLGRHEDALPSHEEVQRYVGRVMWIVVPLIVVGVTIYVIRHRRRRAATMAGKVTE
ncbi:MAG TPA: DedA family protein [Gemmatimonadales bacterium]|nr:DedA family protein [Gemmatimonadales bacterium]